VTSLAVLTACSGGGSSGLQSALGSIANTAGNRTGIYYDNTAALVKIAGDKPDSTKGFAMLLGFGTGPSGLISYTGDLPASTGINVLGENYSISAGTPGDDLTLLSGGQDASKTASYLTRLGWVKHGRTLVAPASPTSTSEITEALSLELKQVSDSGGSNLVFGGASANLSQAGSPSGQTLAQDPVISALASCLGNVAAAYIGTYQISGLQTTPTEVAVGVLSPASNSSVPQAVGCAAWPSAAQASLYQRNLSEALSSGISYTLNERWSNLLTHASVSNVGGPEHVIAWHADTPGSGQAVMQLVDDQSLPALPDCQRLPAAADHRVPGCS
jgi:hypothetical protein